MKSFTVFTLILIFAGLSFAQEKYSGKNEKSSYRSQQVLKTNYVGRHSYDVLNYKLFMDWYNVLAGQSLRYNGIMQVTFRPDLVSPLDSIRLDNDPLHLRVDSAFANGQNLPLNSSNGKLTVFLDKPYSSGDTGVVTLYYHVNNPGTANSDQQKGFYLYYAGEQPTAGYTVPHTVAYTMSEPSDARYWMPCYDDPSDKALSEISVRVPKGFVAASNGTLVNTTDNHDGSVTFNWAEGYPIATYLMCATAAQFSVEQSNYVESSGVSSMPVQYYVYPEDSSAAVSNSECNIDSVVSMIKFYASIYGEYPFEKYGMTGIEPFKYGGMEHQTITTLNRRYEFSRRVVAHELAHQWWGDMVTLGTWNDIWLNESFATYSEAMQLQHLSPSEFENEMQSYASGYFLEDSTIRYPIYAPPPGYLFGLAEYYKGAWVLHMLRNTVGDSTFFAIFKNYRSDFEYGNAVTSDFINVVNQTSRTDMNWFFNEWIYGQGYPVYSYTYRTSGNSLIFYLKQEQTNAPIFKMPVQFAVYSGGKQAIFSFVDSLQLQTATFSYLSPIDSLEFDPNDLILKKTVAWGDSTIPFTSLYLSNYPNPFSLTTQIVYTIPVGSKVRFDFYDVLGRKVRAIDEGYQNAGTYHIPLDGRQLASGAYICRMNTDFGSKTIKILLEK